ncbi:MAG: tRNA pseudouridine(38-40) synthase TruA [Candidatus Cyclobacteriaceae bacterium M2_1C_046]
MRYFFEVSYKGTNYNGWQSQPNALGVQEVIEKALALVLQEEISITGSGRTDTGVHCRQQYFHVDIQNKFKNNTLLYRLNSYLPKDIALNKILPVKEDAHARFDAIKRSYKYRITRSKDPFDVETAFFYGKSLDVPTMNAAASLLLGRQDFESFSKIKTDVNNFICDITEAKWEEKNSELIFNISANRFLRGMVRAIVGTLLKVGKGKISVEEFKAVIEAKDRQKAGAAVAAHGLFLTEVVYPEEIFI